MSDLRERVAGILVDEFPAEIKRPSDAYRVVSEILALLAPREECEHEWHSNAGEDYRLCIKCGISSSPREESGLREALKLAQRRFEYIGEHAENETVLRFARTGAHDIDAALAVFDKEKKT